MHQPADNRAGTSLCAGSNAGRKAAHRFLFLFTLEMGPQVFLSQPKWLWDKLCDTSVEDSHKFSDANTMKQVFKIQQRTTDPIQTRLHCNLVRIHQGQALFCWAVSLRRISVAHTADITILNAVLKCCQ